MNGGRYLTLAIPDDLAEKPNEIIEKNFVEMKSQFRSIQQRLSS
jgi:hypothetical protein